MDFLVAEETVGYGPCLEVDRTSPRYLKLCSLNAPDPSAAVNPRPGRRNQVQVAASSRSERRDEVRRGTHSKGRARHWGQLARFSVQLEARDSSVTPVGHIEKLIGGVDAQG